MAVKWRCICYSLLYMGEWIILPLSLAIDCILLDHVLYRFHYLHIIWDELQEEVYLSQEGLHLFLAGWVRNQCNGLNSAWIKLDPTYGNDVPKEVPLRHCKYALFGIQVNLVFPTLLEYLLQMVYVVWLFSVKENHVIKVHHYDLSDESVEGNVHGALKICTYIHEPKWHSPVCGVPYLVQKVVFSVSSSVTKTWLYLEKSLSKENNSALDTVSKICSIDGTV